jgi:hypothetical protein
MTESVDGITPDTPAPVDESVAVATDLRTDPKTGLPLAGEAISEPTEATPTSPPSLAHTIVT